MRIRVQGLRLEGLGFRLQGLEFWWLALASEVGRVQGLRALGSRLESLSLGFTGLESLLPTCKVQ